MNTKGQIATGAAILGLAGLGGVALSANHQQAADVSAAKPLVRTKVIHRTIHVTKHAKPKHPSIDGTPPGVSSSHRDSAAGTGTAVGAVSTGSSSTGSSESSTSYSSGSEITTSSSGASTAAPVESTGSAPVTTATSGAGGGAGGGGGESEGGDGGGERDD